MSAWPILAACTGRAVPFRDGERSAIAKRPSEAPVAVTALGLAGDEQADRVHHGGPDMAIQHYPREHYAYWDAFLGGHALLGEAGAFGENVSTHGLSEDEACIGDRLRLGSALVEITQGRQPCSKLNHRFGDPRVTAEVVRTGRAGWYYRVLEPGVVATGDGCELVERPCPEWSVARVFRLLVSRQDKDAGDLRALAALPALSAEWRRRAAGLAGQAELAP